MGDLKGRLREWIALEGLKSSLASERILRICYIVLTCVSLPDKFPVALKEAMAVVHQMAIRGMLRFGKATGG